MTNMLITPVFILAILGAVLNPFKNTGVAAEEENIHYAEYNADLYNKRQARAAVAEVIRNRQIELSNGDGKSQEIAAPRKRRSSNEIDGYIGDFKRLEEQYSNASFPESCGMYGRSDEDIRFITFYDSLLDRIREYALTVQNMNDKNALGYLYTATLGRIYNLEDHLEAALVDNITSYFDSVKYDIEKLKDLQNEESKKEITNKYKQDYKNIINKKIKHGKDLVSVEILPETKFLKSEIDEKIENLINEVIELQNGNSSESSDDLRDKMETLSKAVLVQGFLGPLKVLGQALSLISRAEEVAGLAIEFGISLDETLILDIPRTRNRAPNSELILIDLNSLRDEISKFSDQKVNGFKKTLEIVSEEIDKYPTVLAALIDKISDVKNRTDAVVKNRVNIKEVQDLEIELIRIIQTERNETLKTQIGANEQNSETAVAVIDNLLISVQLSSATVDALYKYKDSPKKVVEILNVVQQNERKNYLLKEYENEIYSQMVLSLENITKDLDDIIGNIDKEDEVIFDVTEWDLKYTLRNLMYRHENISVGFSVQGELKSYRAKLKDTIFALLSAQEYIEDYQKVKTLTNFINNIGPNIEGYRRDALRDLEITIRSNIVTQRYKVAIDTFKQVVFPFAETYLERPFFTYYLESDMNKLDSIVHTAIDHFQEIKSQLEMEKSTITRIDQCKASGSFFIGSLSTRPFFTWEKETNQYMFSRLLSGKEVIVKVDISKSYMHWAAIKFKDVEFFFKAENVDAQTKLDKILSGFSIHGTYLGDSYYQYKNKIYLMTSAANFSAWHSLEKDENGPLHKSFSLYRYRHEDAILSPYATWKIKLEKDTAESSFTDLEIFVSQHNVEFLLGGSFKYVEVVDVCARLDEDKYYKSINY